MTFQADLSRNLLKDLPRYQTPIQINTALSDMFGAEIWVKREDLHDDIGSGVKRRAIGAILDKHVETNQRPIIIDGVPQSNCLMAMAHYCGTNNVPLYVILRGRGPNPASGNYGKILASGAKVFELPDADQFESLRAAIVSNLHANGHDPLIVPAGAATPTSLAGPLGLGIEIAEQERRNGTPFDVVVLPVGTGGTITGLALSRNFHNSQWTLVGVRIDEYPVEFYLKNFVSAAKSLDLHNETEITDLDAAFRLYGGALGDGYGKFTKDDIQESERILAKTGLYFSPTYMLKAIRGLSKMLEGGQIEQSKRILLIHTGGVNERTVLQDPLSLRISEAVS